MKYIMNIEKAQLANLKRKKEDGVVKLGLTKKLL